jgi:prephenate dehydratase
MVPGYGMGATVTDRRWTPTDVASPATAAEFAATQDIRTLDAALATMNAAYWTTLRLNQENIWDKLFWLRQQPVVLPQMPF